MRESLAERIKDVLNKVCPAFVYTGEGAALWHGCNCKAQSGIYDSAACTCVWHLTSNCIAGHWEQLDFVDEFHRKNAVAANNELQKAKTVIQNTGKGLTGERRRVK